MSTKKDVYNKQNVDTIVAQLLGCLIVIQFVCEKLKSRGKQKVDIDVILELTKKIIEVSKESK